MRLSIAYASAKVCRLAIESIDSWIIAFPGISTGTGVAGEGKSLDDGNRFTRWVAFRHI
jgi:hypothetical protein